MAGHIPLMAPTMTTKTERYITRKDLSERWNVSQKTLTRWEQAGKITAVFLGERSIRYRLSDIEAAEADASTR